MTLKLNFRSLLCVGAAACVVGSAAARPAPLATRLPVAAASAVAGDVQEPEGGLQAAAALWSLPGSNSVAMMRSLLSSNNGASLSTPAVKIDSI